MTYHLEFTENAKSDLRRLDPPVRKRILKRLAWMEENVDHIRHQSLSGALSDLFKFVVGDYRILYDIQQKEERILIHVIRHRRDVYR